MLGWLLSTAAVAQPAPVEPELRFEQAEFVISDSETPPLSGWQPQALPDSWLHNRPGFAGIGWYRMRFKLKSIPRQTMALYVARVARTGQFWLNESVLNPEVRFTQSNGPVRSNMSRWPQLITLPSGVLRMGENVLHIRVQGDPVGGQGLWDVRIGPREQLHTPWLVREIPQRTIPQILFVLMSAGSVFGLLVWWRDRRGGNLHFTAVMILWTVIVGLWVLPELPLTPNAISIFMSGLYIVFYWTLLALFYRYSESDWRWYPRVLNIVSGLTLLSAIAINVFNDGSPRAAEQLGMAMLPTAFLRLLATVMLLQAAWRKRSPRAYALAATEVLWFAGHLQLIGVMAGWLSPVPFRFDPACSLPLYLVLLYFFAQRFVHDRDQALREQQSAISAERARILQDMHDGMGSQLITALRLAKRPDGDRAMVASSIEEALQDLRLIINSLDVNDEGLLPRLADLRHRLEPRLAELGIRLDWKVQPLPELAGLTPHCVLEILRLVQEALNNAMKHAQAKVISISVTRQKGAAVIGVTDDGIGFDADAMVNNGRGLAGMHKRADQLGATLHFSPREGGGAVVSLHLPPASRKMP